MFRVCVRDSRARNLLCGLTQISETCDTSNRLTCTMNEWISFLRFFVTPRYMKKEGGSNRIGRGILIHTIQTRCREQLVLLSYIASGEEHRKSRYKKKRKNARNQVFPRERNSSPRHAYTRRAMGNEQRDFRAEATDSASRYSNPFLIHLFLLYVRDYSSIGSHSGKRCSTRIECESTRSDLFRLRIVRHSTTTLKSSNQRVDHVRTNIEQRKDRTRNPSVHRICILYTVYSRIFSTI